ncbi:MAG TPA: hypothetical protein VFL14_11615, partial [Xanthomonadales bacterium]|nr:hypothetical protein [Xanthomonadales bacterium]
YNAREHELRVIERTNLPPDALLARYASDADAYTDCWSTVVPGAVTHAAFVRAFYTGFAFRLERFILAAFAKRPSTDADVDALANGTREKFAAWEVEARAEDQLLLRDFTGRTRSWLMVERTPDMRGTQLRFGSAVVPVFDARTGERGLGRGFRWLLGFHTLYSRVLLRAARARVLRAQRG